MSTEHNPVERELRRDLSAHNALRRQVVELERRIARWAGAAESCSRKRRRKKLEATIERSRPTLASLRVRLKEGGEALRKRIVAEMKFSEAEVKAFEEKYRKEFDEHVKAAQSARQARRAADSLSREVPADTAAKVLRKLGRAERSAKGEAKDVKAAEKETASEARDRAFFEDALRRLVTD